MMNFVMISNQGLWMSLWLTLFILIPLLLISFKKIRIRIYEGKISTILEAFKIVEDSPFAPQYNNGILDTPSPVYYMPVTGYIAVAKIKIHGIEIEREFNINKVHKITVGDEIKITCILFFKRKLLLY